MRILAACSLGGSGHWQPLVPLLRAATLRGDEVLVAGPHALADMVEESEFVFRGCGEPSEAEISPIREQLATADRHVASMLGNRELFGRLAATAMLPDLERVCNEWKPESAVVAMRGAIPAATVAISLASAEASSIAVASPALEQHEPGLTKFVQTLPYLNRFPPSLDPAVFTSTIRFRETPAADLQPLPNWWVRSDAPLVYVTFGTVFGHMSFAGDVFRIALEAVADLDAKVLLTVGRTFSVSDLGTVPSNTHVERWFHQHRVFAEAHAVVCHGGSGTSLGALSANVPLIIDPMFADQFVNAQMISASGAGVVVSSNEVGRLRDAIHTVLTDDSYRMQATCIAQEMAEMPSHLSALDEAFACRR